MAKPRGRTSPPSLGRNFASGGRNFPDDSRKGPDVLRPGIDGPLSDSKDLAAGTIESASDRLERIRKKNVELVRQILNYSDTLYTGRQKARFHFLADMLVETAKRDGVLAEAILVGIDDHLRRDHRLQEEADAFFSQVFEEGIYTDSLSCLRRLRREKTLEALGPLFANRVQKVGRSRRRWFLGLSQYLAQEGVELPQPERDEILKRVGLVMALIVADLALSSRTAHAAEEPQMSPNGSPTASRTAESARHDRHTLLKWSLPSAVGALVIILLTKYCGPNERMADQTTEQEANTRLRESRTAGPEGNPAASEAPVLTPREQLAPQCAQLPLGPEHKGCLIKAADDHRDQYDLAQQLYKIAIEDAYDTSAAGPAADERQLPVEGYWSALIQGVRDPSLRFTGYALLEAQSYSATAGLATLHAQHQNPALASASWRDLANYAIQPLDCSRLIQGLLDKTPINESPAILWDGFLGMPVKYASPCGPAIDLQSARAALADGRDFDALSALSRIVQNRNDNPTVFHGLHKYWDGIVPSNDEIYVEATASLEHLANAIIRRGEGIYESGVLLWISRSDSLVGGTIIRLYNEHMGCQRERRYYLTGMVGEDRLKDGNSIVSFGERIMARSGNDCGRDPASAPFDLRYQRIYACQAGNRKYQPVYIWSGPGGVRPQIAGPICAARPESVSMTPVDDDDEEETTFREVKGGPQIWCIEDKDALLAAGFYHQTFGRLPQRESVITVRVVQPLVASARYIVDGRHRREDSSKPIQCGQAIKAKLCLLQDGNFKLKTTHQSCQ